MAGFTDDYGNSAQAVLGRSAGGLSAGLNREAGALDEATKRLHEIAARLSTTRINLSAEMDRINGVRPTDIGELACASGGGSAIGNLFDVVGTLATLATDLQSEAERAQSI